MRVLKKNPGKQYYISSFIIGAGLFIAFSMVIYRHYDDAQKLNDWALYNYEVSRQSRMVLVDLLGMETGVRGYLLSGKKHFLEPYNEAIKTLPVQIQHMRDLTKHDAASEGEITAWLKKIEDFNAVLRAQMRAYNRGGNQALSTDTLEDQKRRMDSLRLAMEQNIKKRLDRLQLQVDASQREQRNFVYILVFGTVLAVGAMLTGTLVILALAAREQKAAREVAEVEERFISIMNGINDGMYDYNPRDETVYFSPALRSMLGYTEAELPNDVKAIYPLLHPDDLNARNEALRRYERHETPFYSNVIRICHKDGNWRWILSRGTGFWDKEGRLVRLVGTHTDITEQKKREEQLRQLNAEMETFTYIASHDLRSPLVNLRGFTRELQQSVETIRPAIESAMPHLGQAEQENIRRALQDDIPEALKFIDKATQRMDTLTTAMLDLSRIGRRVYANERVDVQAIVNKCLDAQNYEINKRNTNVSCDALPWIYSDALALEQIFSNLLDNAVKYLDPTRPGIIHIGVKEEAGEIIFSVADNGRGIAESDKQKVFEIFRRARNTEDIRGLGMGMAYVKATVSRLNGTIWFESELGKGTAFYVRLPKIKDSGGHV